MNRLMLTAVTVLLLAGLAEAGVTEEDLANDATTVAETLKSLVAGFSVSGGHSSQQLRATAAAMRAPVAPAQASARPTAPRARPRTSGANALAQDDWTEF